MMSNPRRGTNRSFAGRLMSGALDLLYPPRCVACGSFEADVCAACTARLTGAAPEPRCPVCHHRWDGTDNCPRCFHWDALDGAIVPFDYEGVARAMIRSLKFRHTLALAPRMAEHIAPLLEPRGLDAIYAVPLHRSRLRSRGFNQAEAILGALARDPAPGGLHRIRKTPAQYGLGARDRARNVAGAFRYTGPELTGATVGLLDDVVTTGVTANECARVLRDMGARKVYVVAFARAACPVDRAEPIHQ